DDVRVLEHRGHAGLVQEHPLELGVLDELGKDALHRAALLEAAGPLEPGQEELGHAARRDLADELVAADLLEAGGRSSGLRTIRRARRGWGHRFSTVFHRRLAVLA